MKAIKKRIRRKYYIPTKDTLVVTAKDNTQRLAKAGDVIITEDDGSQYSMSRTTFDKKYDIIDDSTCISKANEIDFVLNTTDKNIVFPASWGEQITAFPGAAIVLENGTFGYAIQAKEFEETYYIVDENIQIGVFNNSKQVNRVNNLLKSSKNFKIEKKNKEDRLEFEIYNEDHSCEVIWLAYAYANTTE